ncbi:hypothetical protein V8F20_000769 [Naviculisporaceae sp. PSN 640]
MCYLYLAPGLYQAYLLYILQTIEFCLVSFLFVHPNLISCLLIKVIVSLLQSSWFYLGFGLFGASRNMHASNGTRPLGT